MKKPLFTHGVNGKFGKPTDWRGFVMVFLPILLVFFGTYMRKSTGNNRYRLVELFGVIFALGLIYHLKSHNRK